jgi:DNA transformation protein and related proteins
LPYDAALRDRVLEALAPLGEISGRAMFGGYGLFERGAIFGLLDAATLYFKVDAGSKARYVEAGSCAFNPYGDHEDTLFYYAVPPEVLDAPAVLEEWTREAVAVGHATKRPRRRAVR